MVIFAYWYRCDPVTMGRIEKADQLFPYFVVSIMNKYVGVTGLHVSSVYAGSLSTVSSGINAMSLCTIEDFIRPRFKSLSESVSELSTLRFHYPRDVFGTGAPERKF